MLVLNASTPSEIDAAFATMRRRRAGALFVGADPFLSGRRQQIVALAARDAIPAMYTNREFIEEGGLISYGNDTASPANLPVDQATKFEFVINLRAAKTLALEVPPESLCPRRRGDRVSLLRGTCIAMFAASGS